MPGDRSLQWASSDDDQDYQGSSEALKNLGYPAYNHQSILGREPNLKVK